MSDQANKITQQESTGTALSIPHARRPPAAQLRAVAAPISSSVGLGAADFLSVLRHWWWHCVICGVILTTISAALVWATFTPLYEATAWLEVKEQPLYVAFEPHSNPNSKLFFQTQLQTIRSPVVLGRVSVDPQIMSLPEARKGDSVLEWLEKGLHASFRGESELCEITFRSESRETPAKVANAIMDAYLSFQRDQSGQQTERIIELLNKERVQRRAELEHLQERVRVLAKKVTGQDPVLSGGKRDVVVVQNPVVELEARRTAVEVERVVFEAQLKSLQESLSLPIEVVPEEVEVVIDADLDVRDLKAQISRQRAQIRERQRQPGSTNNPVGERMLGKLADLEKALTDLRNELRPKLTADIKAALRTQRARAIAELEEKVENQRQLERVWANRVTEQRRKTEAAGDQSVELEFARAELDRSNEVFQRISDRIVALRTEMSAPMRTSALRRAEPPTKPLEAIPFKRIGLVALLGMLAPFGAALLWERRQHRISNAQQVAAEANLPVLGEITALPQRSLRSGQLLSHRKLCDRLAFEESVDSLRVALTQTPSFRELRTLAVTSAVSREGKTNLSYSLALSMSRCTDGLTLLIDADMRAPDLHAMCDIPQDPGLAEVLSGAVKLSDSIVPHSVERMFLLPAGRIGATPHLLLKNDAFSKLLAHLKKRYRYIVIDCPPVLAASETVVLAGAADGTLLCTMRDVSRAQQLRLTCQKLADGGATLLGAVISGVPTRTWVNKYGGYGYANQRLSSGLDERFADGDASG